MKNWMIALFFNVIQIVSAHATPALFSDNVLTLGDAIVVEGENTRYYQDVRLSPTPNGDFKVLGGVEKALATVTELTVTVIETDPVQVGETPLQTLVACAQVTQPFELEIPLDVRGLDSGDYVVMVNGDSIEFDLD